MLFQILSQRMHVKVSDSAWPMARSQTEVVIITADFTSVSSHVSVSTWPGHNYMPTFGIQSEEHTQTLLQQHT